MRRTTRSLWSLVLLALAAGGVQAQAGKPDTRAASPDLTRTPTLYVVPYAHLDTEWRWDYPTTIGQYLPRTMKDNFALFEKYPHYVFNFSGANRYRMMKEYYPADFARVKQYVAQGRWFPSGSAMEESDVNNPSAESIIRQVLYGTRWFRTELGKTSAEYMLPDCFGFPASLPSILAHMGLKGFSTQKLTWHGAAPVGGPGSPQETPVGVPFNVGYWVGLDGRGVIAALNALDYSGDVTYDLSKTPASPPPPATKPVDWPARIAADGKHGLLADFQYYGTGDIGGAPREWSVRLMEGIVTRGTTGLPLPGQRSGEGAPVPKFSEPVRVGDGPVRVLQTTAERMFLDIRPEWLSRLPRYQGDLELIEHSAGSLTSEAYMKHWNRQNETLADAAERASVAATWLGGRPYPQKRLTDAWTLVMSGQFHDIIPGTSEPKAYEYAWNDQVLALNQFAGVVGSAVGAVAAGMDTRAQGTPVVVYNPLNVPRADVVEARLPSSAAGVRVFDPDGNEVPAQMSGDKVVFVAHVPSVGFAVYDVRPGTPAESPALKVTPSSLENERYLVTLDSAGDIASIKDKRLDRELLSAPARLALTTDKPSQWPAWNIDWNDAKQPPRAYVGGPARVRVVESGPARIALEVTRAAEGSRIVQTIRLGAGDAGNRIEIATALDWKTSQTNLKAAFPFTAASPRATYNWDIGTLQRGNDEPKKFEVPSHQWVDLTDSTGTFGVTLLTGAKNASDKPDDRTLRLTLVRTPGISEGWEEYADQSTQDWGHHEFVYGIAAHAGDWRSVHAQWEALRLDQPLLAFSSGKHDGRLGRELSLARVSAANVRVLALKQAESGDGIIVRLVETEGTPRQGVRVAFAGPLVSARELDGQERDIKPQGTMYLRDGALFVDFTPYQPRTFLVRFAPATSRVGAPISQPVALAYDVAAASNDGEALKTDGDGFDGAGNALPAAMLPASLDYAGVRFRLAPGGKGKANAVAARGQTLSLPAGDFDHVYLLAASAKGDRAATFRLGETPVQATVQQWGGFVGQWDNRQWQIVEQPVPPEPAPGDTSRAARRAREVRERVQKEGPIKRPEMAGLTPGFVKPGEVAWFASHHHRPDGTNAPYEYAYLFAIPLDLPAGVHTLTLPDDPDIRVLAATAARTGPTVTAAQPLFDTLERPGAASARR